MQELKKMKGKMMKKPINSNPLLQAWDTPFGTPPFNLIENEHFKPAIEETIKSASAEIKIIAENQAPPDFENTIAALDRAGTKLGDVTSILFNLNSAETSKELQAIAQDVSHLSSPASPTI